MANLKSMKIDLFPDGVPEDLVFITEKLQEAGFEAFLVGGAVRDIVIAGSFDRLDNRGSDFDFTTNATPEEVISVFRNKGKSYIFTVPTGIEHGTVSVVIKKGEDHYGYEVTTYRVDGHYSDGRHPDSVHFSSSLEEDLARRDFTINAMAYDVVQKELFDPFLGLADIKAGTIRTVGNPMDRFGEDGLRAVRACRFSSQLGFSIELETLAAIPRVLGVVAMVSSERIHDELFKLMKTARPSDGIEYMRETGILQLLLPELMEGYQVDQNEFHRFDVYYHNLYACDAVSPKEPLLRFAALFHDIGKPKAKNFALSHGNGNVFYNHEVVGERMADRLLKRLKFSNSDARIIKKLVKLHMFYYTEEWTDGAVRRFLRKIDSDMDFLNALFQLRRADRIGSGMKGGETEILEKFRRRIQSIIAADNALKVTDLDINGHEIMEHFAIKPSPVIGEMLEHMLELVLDNPELNHKETLFQIGEEYLKTGGSGRHKQEEEEEIPILI